MKTEITYKEAKTAYRITVPSVVDIIIFNDNEIKCSVSQKVKSYYIDIDAIMADILFNLQHLLEEGIKIYKRESFKSNDITIYEFYYYVDKTSSVDNYEQALKLIKEIYGVNE